MKGLSKSKYTLFCQCPKALWMRTYHPEEATAMTIFPIIKDIEPTAQQSAR